MKKTRNSPVIGLTLDHESNGGYSSFDWYAIRENYCGSIARAGGLPVALPHQPDKIDLYLSILDGIVITGGGFDVNPSIFGADKRHPSVNLKENRTIFELMIVKGAYASGIPTLGICGGEQLMNVALGGTLIQHIPDQTDGDIIHEQTNPRDEPSHSISINENSFLAKATQQTKMMVNSAHHQAVEKVANSMQATAFSSDGIIEGIEDRSHKWFIGVQWHPEFEISDGDKNLLDSFIKASDNEHQ